MGTYSFDFAKTMTTGEGGMVVFNDTQMFDRAKAWHDHGHENNPAVPRWEDTRSGSGFNYRMMELQGAVGLAQLRKLPQVVAAQRANRDAILKEIGELAGITLRSEPEGALGTADAVVFNVPDKAAALRCRAALLSVGISTKILPEATTWHFAETWTHMPELVAAHGGHLTEAFPRSRSRLEASVSLPVFVNMAADFPQKVAIALRSALEMNGTSA
jgi:8-amino-3,8-dideoxy-alpha-D-manno-octulosonate transaminase